MARAEVMEAEKVARKENEEKACRREDGEVVDDVEGREREEKREAGWRGTADGRQKEEGGCSCSNDVVALSGLFPSGGFSVSFGDFGCRLRMEGTTALLHCAVALHCCWHWQEKEGAKGGAALHLPRQWDPPATVDGPLKLRQGRWRGRDTALIHRGWVES